jgi:hypothetical protein
MALSLALTVRSLAVFSVLSGKYLLELGLYINNQWQIRISWWVAFLLAIIGAYSHVVPHSIMHSDSEPFYPFNASNNLLDIISLAELHKLCIYSSFIGAILYFDIYGVIYYIVPYMV